MAEKRVDPGVSLGHVLVGKYRVDEILGHGAVGVVARCMHLQLNETVAIKMLRKDVLGDRDAVERFTREARAAVKLRSEYVARVSDVGILEDGAPYMVMEFLDGEDLGHLLAERQAFAVPQVIELMLQAAEALAEAHSIGVVHRDIKPSNLFVTRRPDESLLIKVLDFGISKAPMGEDVRLTQTQSLLGTPAYMSPEQMRSAHTVDAQSDIWSLGTVMYELLEGRLPFTADSFSEMCVKVSCDPPAAMVNAPAALQHVVLRCLEKAPEQRYATMAELGRDLVPFVPDRHHAEAIVERMRRVLRRTPVEWKTGMITPRVPKVELDLLIGEAATEQDPTTQHRATSRAAPARKRPLILLACAAIAALAVVAVWFANADDVRHRSAVESMPPASDLENAGTRQVDATAEPTEPAAETTVPAAEPTEPIEMHATPSRPTPVVKQGTVRRPAMPPTKKATGVSPSGPTDKTTPRKSPSKPCDIYLHPYGCPR